VSGNTNATAIAHLGTLGAQLTADDDLDTLGAILHDESAQGEPMATRQKTNSKTSPWRLRTP